MTTNLRINRIFFPLESLEDMAGNQADSLHSQIRCHRLWTTLTCLLCVCGLLCVTLVTGFAAPAQQTTDPVFVGAGDIADCRSPHDTETANLLDAIPGAVYTLGDNVYERGTLADFTNCYEPTWGRHKARTYPAVGNHDYVTAGASGYYTYFGAAASPLEPNCTTNCKGYYSYDLGAWHIIVLNSQSAANAGSPQEQWLRADLAAHPTACTLAYWHIPRFSSGSTLTDNKYLAFWQALYAAGADVVLNGHEHFYERFAPQNPNGQADAARGIRQFIVGTGGRDLQGFGTIHRNSEVRNNKAWGVLKLTLHATSYDWTFVPVAGQSFTDTGSANCVAAAGPTATPLPTATPTSAPTPLPTRTVEPPVPAMPGQRLFFPIIQHF